MAAQLFQGLAAGAATVATIMDISDTGQRAARKYDRFAGANAGRPKRAKRNAVSRRRPGRMARLGSNKKQAVIRHRGDRLARLRRPRASHNSTMARYGKRGRRSRTPYRRRRGRARKAGGRTRGRASRLKRSHLRLYPGGVPKTHLIKLRMIKQVAISTRNGEWGFISFQPANPHDPLEHMLAATAPVGDHQALAFTLKGGAITPRPQPYGFDRWLPGAGDVSMYDRGVVQGAKIQIFNIPNTTGVAGSNDRYYAGWSRLFPTGSSTFGKTFAQTYANVDRTEISDWINTGLCKRPQIITASKTFNKKDAVFTHTYSLKKWLRHGHKTGRAYDTSNQYFTATGGPVVNPEVKFMIADVGVGSSVTVFNMMVVIDYTIKLSNMILGQESEV